MAYQLKIQLQNVTKPPVWRQVLVPGKFTFHQLHKMIQLVFGWEDCHLYQFSPKGYGSRPVIAIPVKEDWEQPDKDARKIKLSAVFTAPGLTFTYIYDFGDDWVHKITIEKMTPEESNEAVCLAGKGMCPPEDCGGPWGYENTKAILNDPKHAEHQDMKEYLGLEEGKGWDDSFFDLDTVNERLKRELK